MDAEQYRRFLFHKILEFASVRDAAAIELGFTPHYRIFHRSKLERKYRGAHRQVLMTQVEYNTHMATIHRLNGLRV
jgi:hypothetical protein